MAMQLFPTRPAVHVALAAVLAVAIGMTLRAPAVVAWGGAMIAGLALARATAKVAILRLRLAGLEMVWRAERIERLTRGSETKLLIELRNRDARPVRYRAARAIASWELDAQVEPSYGIIAPGGAARIALTVRATRVGKFCVHGLSLEVRGYPGFFEVPLAFANPLGIEVLPRPLATLISSARGGRSRLFADAGAVAGRPGAGSELFELREHVSGDAFKHIAWKASARRGKLLVREFEREDRDVVWLVLDAAAVLLGGSPGRAPLDVGIDQLAQVARRHLARGDRVGLAVAGISPRFWLAPARGAGHALRISRALSRGASALDSDRSDYDESDVGRRVLDHLRFLDATSVPPAGERDLDALGAEADVMRQRAPFDEPAPTAPTAREQALRRYLASFGITSPGRIHEDPRRTTAAMVEALERALSERPKPSLIYVCARPPEAPGATLAGALRKLMRRGMSIRWISTHQETTLAPADGEVERAVNEAITLRARVARERGEHVLGAMGVRFVRRQRRKIA
ncbi:MAG TPA: DUF58 domain-containing protein [Polyangiaceae bacterium]